VSGKTQGNGDIAAKPTRRF
jgi:calcineurin-like phosphoesterase family protein